MFDIKVSQETIETVEKYISSDTAIKVVNKIDSLKNRNVTVTNTGVVSSGKSSLFNALLGIKMNDKNRFSVGAARTTMSKDIEKYSENIVLVDTPGIDVKNEDDEVALNAICASSIIVMVHNIKMGMLQNNEVEWLKKIAINFNGNKKQLKDRFIFVNSWIDERMMESSYQSTVDETKRILFETLETEVEVYNVSAKLYIKGISENKQKFIDVSNILKLKEAITKKAEFFAKNYGVSVIQNEVADLCGETSGKLRQIKVEKVKIKEEQSATEIEKFKAKKNQWNTDFKRFKDLADRYNDVVRKINNL